MGRAKPLNCPKERLRRMINLRVDEEITNRPGMHISTNPWQRQQRLDLTRKRQNFSLTRQD
jgi:hypothetical protein